MSDTPRTDTEAFAADDSCYDVVQADFARDLERENARLRDALKSLVTHYVDLVDTGDAGVWDAETEPVVVNARAAIDAVRKESA
jgi:hypothetical protein